MTVRELIDLLQQHPAGLRVVVNGYEEDYDDLSPQPISTTKIVLNTGKRFGASSSAGSAEVPAV